ncbi:MAG: flagellar protein FliT [Proteobacteria bacterium]|nr:flagellar protein FliT [Pseudomonadota bacterium]
MILTMATPSEPTQNNRDLLSRYEEILRQSRRMMEAARDGDWELLIELEHVRAALNKVLMEQEQSHSRSLADQSAKAELIRNILASDAETRLLIEPRQQELKTTFGSIDTERKLQKAYDMTW